MVTHPTLFSYPYLPINLFSKTENSPWTLDPQRKALSSIWPNVSSRIDSPSHNWSLFSAITVGWVDSIDEWIKNASKWIRRRFTARFQLHFNCCRIKSRYFMCLQFKWKKVNLIASRALHSMPKKNSRLVYLIK